MEQTPFIDFIAGTQDDPTSEAFRDETRRKLEVLRTSLGDHDAVARAIADYKVDEHIASIMDCSALEFRLAEELAEEMAAGVYDEEDPECTA